MLALTAQKEREKKRLPVIRGKYMIVKERYNVVTGSIIG
jgi:hypothetical protein